MAFVKKVYPILAILIFILFLFNTTLFPPEGKMIYGGDIYEAYYFWKNYLGESIKEGVIPFWNPYNFSGTPFLAHPNINIFYPPNWLFIFLPLTQSFSWYFAIHIFIAALNMYWLGRQFTGRWGAFTSSVIYSLGGYFAARVYSGHLEYVDSAAWVPLVFGLSRNALINPSTRNLVFSSLGSAILLLAGNELIFLFTMELIILYFLYFLVAKKRKSVIDSAKKGIVTILISLLLAFGLTAGQLMPRYQFMALSLRSEKLPYSVAGAGSLPFEGLRLFIDPFFWGLPFRENYTYRGPWPDLGLYNHYVGILPIVIIFGFLIYTIFSKFKTLRLPHLKLSSEIWFFLLLVIPFFLLISFGTYIKPNIHGLLWEYTPPYRGIRLPARHLFMVVFSVSLVAGIIMGSWKNKILKTVVISAIIIDLILFSKQFIRLASVPTETFDPKLISIFQNDKSLYRVLPDYAVVSSVRRDLDFGAATMYRVQTTSDYNSMILWRYYHFIDLLNKKYTSSISQYNVEIPPPDPTSAYIDFLNIKYVLADKNYDPILNNNSGKYKEKLEGKSYRLYENADYYGRFFIVHDAKIYANLYGLENAVLLGDLDVKNSVGLLKKDLPKSFAKVPNCPADSGKNVTVVDYSINRIILKTNSSCDGFLSSSEVYYPGWKAKLDNRPTKIFLSNYAFRTIFLPKGVHTVEFYYSPMIYFIGLFISIISLTGLFILSKKVNIGKH